MPDLSPQKYIPKLRDNWFKVVPNPEDHNDKSLCIQVIEGPFHYVILKIHGFGTDDSLNDDGSLNCTYKYDIIFTPSDIGERTISDAQGEKFEENIGKAILELLEDTNDSRNNDSGESITK